METSMTLAPNGKPMIYGLCITLTCPVCRADCPLEDLFTNLNPFKDVSEQALDKFMEAWTNHRILGCTRRAKDWSRATPDKQPEDWTFVNYNRPWSYIWDD